MNSPTTPQETEEISLSDPNDSPLITKDGQDEPQGDIVWQHGRLPGYKVANGKPLVLVSWYPTWEPLPHKVI